MTRIVVTSSEAECNILRFVILSYCKLVRLYFGGAEWPETFFDLVLALVEEISLINVLAAQATCSPSSLMTCVADGPAYPLLQCVSVANARDV